MKILLFGNAKLKYMPYINFYLENIDTDVNEVHVIYWNRDLKDEQIDVKDKVVLHEFRFFQKDECSKLLKIKSYFRLRQYASRLIKKEKFDFIIALDSLPGVIILNTLKNIYRDRFIFDYRDSSYEYFPPFRKAMQELVDNSYFTFVSSDGFRRYFTEKSQQKIITSHNLLLDALKHRDDTKNKTSSQKIRIAFWGMIREEETNLEIIKKISGDNRLEVHYYGREEHIAHNLKKYVTDNHIENVYFHGEYQPDDRYKFILNTDIIHNIYNGENAKIAMGNKYYDGVAFRIPQLCMESSLMGDKVIHAKIGWICNPYSEDFTDGIVKAYNMLDWNRFNGNCDQELEKILDEYNKGIKIIHSILK